MNNKRELLKKLAGISAVATMFPSAWVKPVVNSVLLPAHAQTSIAPTVTATISGYLIYFHVDGVFVSGKSGETGPIENSLYILGAEGYLLGEEEPEGFGDDIVVSIQVNSPFRASPSIVRTPISVRLETTVNILDSRNAIVKTISVRIGWAP